MSSLQRVAAVVDRLNDRIGAAIQWLTLIMVLVGAFNALARYATRYTGLSLSSNAYLDLQWYFFSLIFLLGAGYGLNHEYHVRVDILYEKMGRRSKAWLDLLGTVLFLIPFSAVMLWVSWTPVWNSWRIRESSPDPGGLPRYPIKAVILVAFLLLLLQGLSYALKQATILWGSEDSDTNAPDPAGSAESGLAPEDLS